MNLNIEKIVREYIQKTVHMSLGTSRDNKPWVCEVHFAYDEDLNLYFRSQPHRRHCQEIADNPNVAGNIVQQHELGQYPHAIYFEGTAERLTDEDELKTIFRYIKEKLQSDESILEDAKLAEGHHFYKITVKNWFAFGKFGGDSGNKYELAWNGGRK